MTFEKTNKLMWDLFTSQFGFEKEGIWYFKSHENSSFKYALDYYMEKLWLIPMGRTDELLFDYESTAYVTNAHLNKFSRNSYHILNDLNTCGTTIFQSSSSNIDASLDHNLICFKGLGQLCQQEFFTFGGLEAINVSVEYVNRLIVTPSIIDVSQTPLELNRLNVDNISNYSKKNHTRYKTSTAIIANNTIHQSAANFYNETCGPVTHTKIFFDKDYAKEWALSTNHYPEKNI